MSLLSSILGLMHLSSALRFTGLPTTSARNTKNGRVLRRIHWSILCCNHSSGARKRLYPVAPLVVTTLETTPGQRPCLFLSGLSGFWLVPRTKRPVRKVETWPTAVSGTFLTRLTDSRREVVGVMSNRRPTELPGKRRALWAHMFSSSWAHMASLPEEWSTRQLTPGLC